MALIYKYKKYASQHINLAKSGLFDAFKAFLLILFNSNQVWNNFKSINTDNIYPIFCITQPASKVAVKPS